MALTGEQVAQIAAQAGFTGRELIYMVAIAKRESGYNPAAHRSDTDKSKLLGDRGLWQINNGNDAALIKAGIIKNKADLFNPVINAKAAFWLAGGRYDAQGKPIAPQSFNLKPWGATPGKGWSEGGNPLAGVNVGAATTAVNNAQARGMLGQPYFDAAAALGGAGTGAQPKYTSPGSGGTGGSGGSGGTGGAGSFNYNYAGTPPMDQGASTMNAQEERDAFNKYLRTKTPEEQKAIIEDLKKPRSLAEVGAWMGTASEEAKRYVNFLGTLNASGQYGEKNLLAAPDPAGSKEMTDLLNTFGVSYPNAPNPTPALLAFLKGIGLNLSTAEDVKRRALERIGASTSDAMADIDRTAGRTKQNVTADIVRRGVLSSGESNTRYARHEEDVGNQKSDVTRTSTQATESVEDAYTQARDLARQQALDRIIGAEQTQATERAQSAAQVDATRASQQAADDAWQRQKAAQDASIKAQEDALRQSSAAGV